MDTATPLNPSSLEGLPKKSMTRHLPTVGRVVMGLIFFVFGLNGFLDFIPPPPDMSLDDPGVAFGIAMKATGYLFWLVKGTEVLAGALFLANRFVPLALALIAPVIVNIFLFHVFLAPAGTGMAVFLLVLEIFLAWSYRAAFRPMLAMCATASV